MEVPLWTPNCKIEKLYWSVWGCKIGVEVGVWGHKHGQIWGWIKEGLGFLGSEIKLNWGGYLRQVGGKLRGFWGGVFKTVLSIVWSVFEGGIKGCVQKKFG